jgi:hypothetical protein
LGRKSENLSKYWGSGTCSVKDRIQKTVFPKGLVIDPQNRTYRTNNINTLFEITNRFTKNKEGDKKEKVGENTDLSWEVAGNLEISNLLEDFYKVVDLYDFIAEDSRVHQT